MYRVTLPNGKVYTFRPNRAADAQALARRTGGLITSPLTGRTSFVCSCSVVGCQGCDDAHDARRDAYREGRR